MLKILNILYLMKHFDEHEFCTTFMSDGNRRTDLNTIQLRPIRMGKEDMFLKSLFSSRVQNPFGNKSFNLSTEKENS